jgi:hypothetical protein
MTIFFHHVGQVGATRDFPRTVILPNGQLVEWSMERLENHLNDLSSNAINYLREEVLKSGPDSFQIWGIPSGGERAIGKLDVGDYMLLLGSERAGSTFEYAGRVIARVPIQARDLSKFLWGESRFPIIFFMRGVAISYPWDEFKSSLHYSSNWTVRGNSYSISNKRISESRYGNEEAFLREIAGSSILFELGNQHQIAPGSVPESLESDLLALALDVSLSETDRQALILARIGQGVFREEVLSLFEGRCAVTGCRTSAAIRASHVKPWSRSTNIERLDPSNGIPLVANLDALFDRHLITFNSNGSIVVSHSLSRADAKILNAQGGIRLAVNDSLGNYLMLHRNYFYEMERDR